MPAPTLTGQSAAHRTGDRASASLVDLFEDGGPVAGTPRMSALKASAAAGPMAGAGEPTGPLAFAGTGGPSVGITSAVRAGTEIRVNTATTSTQDQPQITTLSNGGFVITWRDNSGGVGGATGDASGFAVKAQVFAADGTPTGTEIRVNTATASNQESPQITALSNGGFVVTWRDASLGVGGATGDASSFAVKAQVFAADGTPTGSEILVNTATASSQDIPQITALSNGGFVVTWRDASLGVGGATGDASSFAVKAQVFAADGTPTGTEIRVNTATASIQDTPQITALSNGGFVVTWEDNSGGVGGATGDASSTAVKAQVFAADGTPTGSEILVNTATDNNQDDARITALTNGGFVVTWRDLSFGVGGAGGDASGAAVKAQVFAADGTPTGSEIRVNTATANAQSSAEITALQNGGFVIIWRDTSQGVGGATGDSSGSAVKAQVFAADGAPTGSEILVNIATTNTQDAAQITALANGGFVITWQDTSFGVGGATGDTFDLATKAQVFAANGTHSGPELLVNTAVAGGQGFPQVTALPNGGFVVTWTDESGGNGGATGDASGSAIKAQVFNAGLDATEQVALSLKNRGFTVTDPDAADVLSVTLSVTYGVLNVTAGGSGATVTSGNGTASVVLSGTASQISALLNGDLTSTVTFTAHTDTPPASATITLSVDDGAGGTATTNAAIAITDVFDAPVATPGDDILIGSAADETIDGLAGDDIISGRGGNDTLDGNTGSDTASYATAAAGVIARLNLGMASNDGDGGSDTFISIENLTGSTFADLLVGDAGDNVLTGRGGNDTLDGNTGNDTASYATAAAGVIARLNLGTASNDGDGGSDTFVSIENLTGSGFNDTLVGNGASNVLSGGTGYDTLVGLAGNDILIGGSGTGNELIGGLGDDTYEVSANDTIVELVGQGYDEVRTSNARLTLAANIEALTYTGGGAFTGFGNALGNLMRGGAGDDVLSGLGGDDTFLGEGGSDTVDYGLAASAVTAFLDSGTASDGDGGTDGFQSIENLRGSAFGDLLYGNFEGNILDGGAGDDILVGRAGNDTLRGGAGIDTADYSDATAGVAVRLNGGTTSDGEGGTDIVSAVENVNGGGHDDLLIGSALGNSLNGGLGRDTLVGLAGNDTLRGGTGVANELIGGLGDDTYVVDANDTVVEFVGEGTDTVETTRATFTLRDHFENLTFTGAGAFIGRGNAEANVINGGAGDDVLTGGLGNDTLNGGLGRDTAVMSGASFEYTIEDLGLGQFRITDNVAGRDGVDILNGMEEVRYGNGVTGILIPGGAPAPVLSDKDAGAAQVLPGLGADDFPPLAKDADLPLVLPGADAGFGQGRTAHILTRTDHFALTIDQDGRLVLHGGDQPLVLPGSDDGDFLPLGDGGHGPLAPPEVDDGFDPRGTVDTLTWTNDFALTIDQDGGLVSGHGSGGRHDHDDWLF